MPTLTPPPTITIPTAPVRANAQPQRSGRTFEANTPEPAPFKAALSNATKPEPRADPIDLNAGSQGESAEADPEIAADQSAAIDDAAPEQGREGKTEIKTDTGSAEVAPDEQDTAADTVVTPDEPSTETDPASIDPSVVVAAIAAAPQGPVETPGTTPSRAPDEGTNPRLDEAPAEPAPKGTTSTSATEATSEPQQGVQLAQDPTRTQPEQAPPSQEAAPEQVIAAPAARPVSEQRQAPESTISASAEQPTQAAVAGDAVQAADQPQQDQGGASQQDAKHADLRQAQVAQSQAAPEQAEPALAQALRDPAAESAPVRTESLAHDPAAPAPAQVASAARPALPAPAPSAPSIGTVETEQAFPAAVNRGLAAAVRQQGGTLTIKLDPPSLGKLTIRMTIDQGRVEASFDTTTAQARDLLLEHASSLRAQLRDRGLTVERLEVVGAHSASAAKPGHSASNSGDHQGDPRDQDDSQHDAGGGQSRGRSETGEDRSSSRDGGRGDMAGTAGAPGTSSFETSLRYSVSALA